MAPPPNGAPPAGTKQPTSRLPGRQGQRIGATSNPTPSAPARAPSAGTPPPRAVASTSVNYEEEVKYFISDLLDLHKSAQQALNPQQYGFSPEVTRQVLANECRRSSRSLLRVVASASGVTTPSLEELDKKLTSNSSKSDDARIRQMESWMKEMQGQMVAMQKKQDDLVAENQSLKDTVQKTKVELKQTVEAGQKAYSQALSGAVRAELTGDLSSRLEAAIKPEANKFVHSIFAQKVMEITGNQQQLLGDAWQQGYAAFANDNGHAPPPLPNTNPHRGVHPPPVDASGRPMPPPPPPAGASDYVSQAQFNQYKNEAKVKLNASLKSFDDAMNLKLEKADERTKGKLDRMQSRLRAGGLASKEGSPKEGEPNGMAGAARKRARVEADGDATMQGSETDAAEAAARQLLAEEVDKIKKDLAALKAQVDAQAKAPPPPPPTKPIAIEPTPPPASTPSAASLTNYVLKFTYQNKIEELDAQIAELEKASQTTNKLVRDQKAKLLEDFEQQLEDVKVDLGTKITAAERAAARASSNQPQPLSLADVTAQVDTRISELALDTVEDRLSAAAQEVVTLDQNVKRIESDIVENVKIITATQQELGELKITHEEDYQAVQMLVETSGNDLMAKMEKGIKEMDLGERVGTVVKDEVAAVLSGESVQRLMQPGLEKVEKEVEKRVGKVEEEVKSVQDKAKVSEGTITRHESRLTAFETSRTETNLYISKIDHQLQSVGQSMRGVLQYFSTPQGQPQPQPQPQTLQHHAASPTQQYSPQQQHMIVAQQQQQQQQQQQSHMGAMYQQQQPR